jgi:hypothetical protein
MIALSMEVLVDITHKSAVVLDTRESDTRSMKPVSAVKTPGRIIFNRDPRRLKKTAFTATLSLFLPPRLGGAEAPRWGCWVRSFITNAARVASAPMMATDFTLGFIFDRAPIFQGEKKGLISRACVKEPSTCCARMACVSASFSASNSDESNFLT